MDDSVIAAIARWPNVPHVYGWLSLDQRGRWRLQDSPIANPHITDFIARNYDSDERGAWFFQNGPQRVYVQLEYTPWILRIGDGKTLTTHTNEPVRDAVEALLDENGNLLIAFESGIGMIEDRDLPALLDAIVDAEGNGCDEANLSRLMQGEPLPLWLQWQGKSLPISPVRHDDVAQRYGFVTDPQPDH
jgi:Protein of unknown function (DUF2946)